MKSFRLLALILGALLVLGCTTYKYQGHNFPSLSSPSFPSFNPVGEIPNGIKVRPPEGTGKTKMVMDINISKGSQSTFIQGMVNWRWDITVVNNLIYNNHFMEIAANTNISSKEKRVNFRVEGIHEITGKEIKLKFVSEGYKDSLTAAELDRFKKQMSDYINGQFASVGKTLNTGDVLKYIPNEMATMDQTSDATSHNKFPEIVKGIGVYKDKKVLVTEVTYEDSVNKSDFVMELRGKGYSLYDTETFIQIFGEHTIFASAFTQKEGTVYLKIDARAETYDVKVKNVADSETSTGGGIKKESAKAINERLEELKRLKDKSLITDEDYEKKKKQILDEL